MIRLRRGRTPHSSSWGVFGAAISGSGWSPDTGPALDEDAVGNALTWVVGLLGT